MGNELDAVHPKKAATGKTAARAARDTSGQIHQKAKVVKTPSLKETLHRIDSIGKEKQDEKVENNAHEASKRVNIHITQDQVTEQYGIFMEKIKKEQPRLYSSMKVLAPVRKENGVVELYFQNNSLLEEFKQRIKPSMISHYRNALNGIDIEIQEFVQDVEKVSKPNFMNDAEKFEKMSEKNPALKKLKNLFNLDFD